VLRPACALLLAVLFAGACGAATPSATQLSPSPPQPTLAPTTPPPSTATPVLTPSPTLGAMVADSAAGFDFLRPAGWQRSLPVPTDPTKDQSLLFLANFPLLPECAAAAPATPQPSASAGQDCLAPFGLLPAGAAFVEIYDSLVLGPQPKGGAAIEVAGLPSHLELAEPGRCANQIVDRVLIAPIPEPPTGTQYHLSVVACLRAPDMEENERAVRAFIASLKRR